MGLVDELSARIDSARAAYNERVNAATDAFNKAAGAYHDEIDAANAEFSAIAIQSVNGFTNKTIGNGPEEFQPHARGEDPDAEAKSRVDESVLAAAIANGILPRPMEIPS